MPRRSKLHQALLNELQGGADPARAADQQRYMKSTMPYLGLLAPDQRARAAIVFEANPLRNPDHWRREVLGIWRRATFREERYAALQLAFAKSNRQWLTTQEWPLLDELTVTGAWWDMIDNLAPNHYAHLLQNERAATTRRLLSYAKDDDIWRRRVAILVQLKAKRQTDEKLLFDAIKPSVDHPEFFVRKAIGWALRAYSRTDADAVRAFVARYDDRLSALSKREALKLLK